MTAAASLPYLCPDHPYSQIRHEWDRTQTTIRLTGKIWEHNEPGSDQYFCNECGVELSEKKPDAP